MAEPDKPRIHSQQVRKMAEELGVDLDEVEGTGPRGGVTLTDVQRAVREQTAPAEGEAMPDDEQHDAANDGEAEAVADEGEPLPDRRELWERWTDELRGYGNRLTNAGEPTLGGIVLAHAMRARDVGEGRRPPPVMALPSSIDPAMVGRTLALTRSRRNFERLLEMVRNILIFVPVLVAWIKISLDGLNDLGDMRGVALLVAVFIVALIVTHVGLGMMRQWREARAERIARQFAEALAALEMSLPSRTDGAESAIAAFAQVGAELTASLRGAGESLVAAHDVMDRMARTVELQGEQVGQMLTLLEPIARIGEQIGGVQVELRDVTAQLGATARTLGDIRQNLAPTSEQLAGAASALGGLTGQMETTGQQLGRMSEVFGSRFEPLDQAAANVEEAAKALNVVAERMLAETDGGKAGG